MFDPNKPQEGPTAKESVSNLVSIWMHLAEEASHIAVAKRRLYLAYIAEGFSEGQALELCKHI